MPNIATTRSWSGLSAHEGLRSSAMTTEQWIAASSVAAVFVAVVAIVISMAHVRDQLRTFIFLVYTDRYSRVMAGIPADLRRPGGHVVLSDLAEDKRQLVVSAFRDYFNMCSEEMWLKSSDRVDAATWKVWHAGMCEMARLPILREVWTNLADEYAYFPKFKVFMDGVIKQAEAAHPARALARSADLSAKPDGVRTSSR